MLYNKHVLDKLLHFSLTLCIVFRKNNLFLARLPGISAIRIKIIDVIIYWL